MTDELDKKYRLEDVQVATLGLVSRGANQEDFFLLKSEDKVDTETVDANKMQEANQSEMEEKVTKNVWQRLVEFLKQGIADSSILNEIEAESTEKFEVFIGPPVNEVESISQETVKEDIKEEVVITEKMPEIVVEEKTEETQKGESTMPEEMISKAEFEKAQVQLAELQKALDDERVEKAKMTWINKAASFGYVPVSSKELGEHLYNLAKYDAKEADWLTDLLKSYDAMLEDSGLFMEKGTSKVENDVIEKALKADNPKDALLALPRKDADEYLREMRKTVRG